MLPGQAGHMSLLLPAPRPPPTMWGYRAPLSPSLVSPWIPFLACGGGGRDSGGGGQSFTHQKLLVSSPERREQKAGPGQVGWVSASCDKLCEPGCSCPSGLWNEYCFTLSHRSAPDALPLRLPVHLTV